MLGAADMCSAKQDGCVVNLNNQAAAIMARHNIPMINLTICALMGHTMGTNLRGINAYHKGMIKALWTIIIVRIIEVCQIIIMLIPIT